MNHSDVNKIVEAMRLQDSNIILKQAALIQILEIEKQEHMQKIASLERVRIEDRETIHNLRQCQSLDYHAHRTVTNTYQEQIKANELKIDGDLLYINKLLHQIELLKAKIKRRPKFIYIINRKRKVKK